jgi:molybdopterin-containing oxidoreductase family iron-sulfur binding subunit
MQASILGLYDPDRSQAVVSNGEVSSWTQFLAALGRWMREHAGNHGAGLHVLTETVTSPALGAQLIALLDKFPRAKWHQFDPVSCDSVRAGARLAFGEIVSPQYRFDRAEVIVSLESDFLYSQRGGVDADDHRLDGGSPDSAGERRNRAVRHESRPGSGSRARV